MSVQGLPLGDCNITSIERSSNTHEIFFFCGGRGDCLLFNQFSPIHTFNCRKRQRLRRHDGPSERAFLDIGSVYDFVCSRAECYSISLTVYAIKLVIFFGLQINQPYFHHGQKCYFMRDYLFVYNCAVVCSVVYCSDDAIPKNWNPVVLASP